VGYSPGEDNPVQLPVTAATVAAAGLVGYLIGGIPVGWMVVRRQHHGLDLRRYGSGNVGTSNVFRHVGLRTAALIGPVQFAQGLVPVVAAREAGFPLSVEVLIGLCAVIGNGWPIYLGFNGGRGIAVATGVVAGLNPYALAGLLACYVLGLARREIAIGVLTGFVLLPAVALIVDGWTLFAGCLTLLVIVVMRRLEGIISDLRIAADRRAVILDRIVRDRRPGRPLVGPVGALPEHERTPPFRWR
jgi:glycerol-3-phosphate acyltransferase PlsY